MRAKEKSFIADAAHELRTPLAALKIQAQTALKTTDPAIQQDLLLKIIQEIDRCSNTVTQLLTLNGLAEEEQLNEEHTLDLYQLTAEILALLAPAALKKKIDIELAPPPQTSYIHGNAIALGILLRNIIDNAVRYTPEKGAVKIILFNQRRSLILRVTDTGPGIAPEHHEKIFERFYRVPNTIPSGSGLGLAIVKQIAKSHHARITLDSLENETGLRFDVIFTARR
jgi:two-component system sensor histidine kinase QseC